MQKTTTGIIRRTKAPLLTFVLLLPLIIAGCSKNNLNKEEANLVESVLTAKPDEQRAAYQLLSPNEKSLVWQAHIKAFLKSEPLTPQQSAFCNTLLTQISPSLFNKAQRTSEFDLLMHNMKNEAIATLGFLKAAFLLTSLHASYREFVASLPGNASNDAFLQGADDELASGKCGCNTSSDWCIIGRTCKQSYNCTNTTDGCGTTWSYSCNGKCE
jgi:hypothetical protein